MFNDYLKWMTMEDCGLELPQRHATDDDGNEHSEEQFT